MISGSLRRRWLPLAGATVALLLGIAACGDDTPAASTSTTADQSTSSTTRAEGGATTSTPASHPVLGPGIEAVGDRYAFTATITLDGAVVTQVDGVVYDGAGSYTVASGGSSVEYVVSDQGQWAREAGGDWTALAGAAPLSDPLEPLGHPTTVQVLEDAGGDALIDATYDGASLGFADSGEVGVTVTVTAGSVTRIAYDIPVGDGVATVVTTFDGDADVSPIQVPPT